MDIINVENLSFWYPDSDKTALKNINLSIKEGEFILIVGPSGCGKSTLLRLFNRIIPDFYGGRVKGSVNLLGTNIRNIKKEDIVKNVGMVFQHPEKQIVMEDVERELAFGLENFNLDLNTMGRNIAEAMSFLGISKLKNRATSELSGGEKQRVAIASVISMDPEIILFDEPVSQLDPIAAEEVLNVIKRLNRDLGKTVILVEQRLDRCFDMADRIIFMEDGMISGIGTPQSIPENIHEKYHIPGISYVFKEAGYEKIPVNVKEARDILGNKKYTELKREEKEFQNITLEVRKVSFEYKKGEKILNNINLKLHSGEVLAVMGENGAGKSTLFKIIAGALDKYTGDIKIKGEKLKNLRTSDKIKHVGYLSQNPNDYFGRPTVFDEVGYTLKNIEEYDEKRVDDVIRLLNLDNLRDRNPRDLSGGEKQRAAIACTLVSDPKIIILDEPTRGMDSVAKDNLGEIIMDLKNKGKSIVIITHDSDFAAEYADNAMLLFNGEIAAYGCVDDILYGSIYYSSQIARVFKGKAKVISSRDAAKLLKVIK